MNKYVFKPYSPLFPQLFAKERERIASSLPLALEIEHVGSTSVEGLGGKGIIDIAIAVQAKEEFEEAKRCLENLDYSYESAFSTPTRWYFIAYLSDSEEQRRRYHIHLTYLGSNEWNEMIGFRDYLREHPHVAENYAEIKKKAADEANHEGAKYREMKKPFIDKILAIVLKEID